MSKECRRPRIKLLQWRIQGKGPGDPGPPLFFDQNEVRRDKTNFFGDRPPPYLRLWMTAPSPYLKVCIRNCIVYRSLTTRTVWQQLCKCLNVEFLLTFNELLKRYNIVPSSQFAAEQMFAINSGPEGGNG